MERRTTTTDSGLRTSGKPSRVKRRGLFITLEGIDGAGKSTQLRRLAGYLRRRGWRICVTREPGGTYIGEQIRKILLTSPRTAARTERMTLTEAKEVGVGSRPVPSGSRDNQELAAGAELALMYAARAQHLQKVVRPALAQGEVVLSDRFNDASFAYQGYGRRIGTAAVRALDRIICGRTQPDLTVLLDMAPRLGLERATARDTRNRSRFRRFEIAGLKFQERVRRGYLAIARREPRRVKVVDASRPVDEVQRDITRLVDTFLARRKERQKSQGKNQKAKVRNA